MSPAPLAVRKNDTRAFGNVSQSMAIAGVRNPYFISLARIGNAHFSYSAIAMLCETFPNARVFVLPHASEPATL